MRSKARILGLLSAVCFVMLGTGACKRSDTSDGSLSAPGSQIPRDTERTVPGARPGQAPDMPSTHNSQ